jgi:hypothetical protein
VGILSTAVVPSQTGNAGKVLTTDGTTASWGTFATLASPTFTGTPAAPTAAADTNTTQIATTAYVIGQGYLKSATASSTYAPLASPTFSGTVSLPAGTAHARPILTSPIEVMTVSATAATGTIQFDAVTQGVLYYTTASSANWSLNVRGNSSTTLSSILGVGQSISIAFMATNTTAYYQTAVTIDGSAQTVKWQGGTAPSAGNANSIDVYTLTIVKTAATPTYTAFGALNKFA